MASFSNVDEVNDAQGQGIGDGGQIALSFDVDEDGKPLADAPPEQEAKAQSFDGNLAEHIDVGKLKLLASEICLLVEDDLAARSKWEDGYKKILPYLGLGEVDKDLPWSGACAVVHPLLLEAVVRFSSRALNKLYPNRGPATISIERSVSLTPKIQELVGVTQDRLNKHIFVNMPETMTESDALLMNYAQIGTGFKKVEFDETLGRTATKFIPAESLVMPYSFGNLRTSPRFTEIVRRDRNNIEELQEDGFFLDTLLLQPNTFLSGVEEKKADISGQEPTINAEDTVETFEVYMDRHIDEDTFKREKKRLRSPYVITIDRHNQDILAIRRNWRQDDPRHARKSSIVKFTYVPGFGAYDFGLMQMIGQFSLAATKLLRQLVDAGTLYNLQAAFMSSALTMESQGPMQPGEFRKIEASPEDLKNGIVPFPFKEPSRVLYELLLEIVKQGKDFSSMANLDISSSSQNAPVGTTLAIMERQTEVSNAVQKRMYVSFTQELNIIVQFIEEYEPEVYKSIFGDLIQAVGNKDSIIISPSGDPESSSMAQRILQLQAIAANAAQSPQVFNLVQLHRTIITAMGLPDANILVPDKTDIQPMGIVEEHMAILNGTPIKAFEWQEHEAHIMAHLSFLQDPQYQQVLHGSPQAQALVTSLMAHIAEHLAFQYRNEIQSAMGVQLPPLGQQLPPDIENSIDTLVAQASKMVQQSHAAQAQQQAAAAQQADPAYQLEKRELDIKQSAIDSKHQLQDKKLNQEADFKEKQQIIDSVKALLQSGQGQASMEQAGQHHSSEMDNQAHDLALRSAEQIMSVHQAASDVDQQALDRQHEAEQAEAERQSALELAQQQAQNQPSPNANS